MSLIFSVSKFDNNLDQILQELDNVETFRAVPCDPEDVLKNTENINGCTTVISQNIRSITHNFNDFTTLLSRTRADFDIIFLSECWLKSAKFIPNMPNYNSHKTNDDYNQNDGVVAYIKKSLIYSIEEPPILEANCLLIKLSSDMAILGIYRPHCFKQNTSKFLNSLHPVLLTLAAYKTIVITGDINIDISPGNVDPNSDDYLNLLASHGILPTHTLPTRLNTCLDHLFIKTCLITTTLILQTSVSDHDSIVLSINLKQQRGNTHKLVNKIDYIGLEKSLQNIDFTPVLKSEDSNSATNLLINSLSNALDANKTVLHVSRREKTIKPWITKGLLRCMRNRDNMHKKLKSNPNNEILATTYRRYRNYCNNILKNLKREYEKSELQKASKNNKKLWDTIKKVTNMTKPNDTTADLLKIAPTPKQSVDHVNEYYINVGKTLAENIQKTQDQTSHVGSNSPHTGQSFVMLDTDEEEIERIIKNLKSDSAIGWDGIPSSILKQFIPILTPPITHICRLSLQTGVFPDAFKKSLIHPIFKSGSRDRVVSYRPISILPSISKILEKIINTRLTNYLEQNSILSRNQYGFRRGKSTADAVHDLTDNLIRNMDGGKKSLTIFLDLAKAFDTVSIPLLLTKIEKIGIRGTQLNLFQSYLTNRQQFVKIGDYCSRSLPISFGIPQGSILGPTLFLIFINDLCNTHLENGNILTFADDTALIFNGTSWEDTFTHAQQGLNTVTCWLNKNLLTINVDKTKYITFSIRNPNRPHPPLDLIVHSCSRAQLNACSCASLEMVSNIKYLGILIDEHLNFQSHIDQLVARTRKFIYVFKTLRHISDQKIIKQVYYAICQSVLNYCINVWGGVAKTYMIRLERAQRAILKVATFRPFMFPTTELYRDCEVLTVRQLFILSTVLRQHSSLTYNKAHAEKNRRLNFTSWNSKLRKNFSSNFYCFLGPYLYTKINNILNIYPTVKLECKYKLTNWLRTLNYEDTESLLTVLK